MSWAARAFRRLFTRRRSFPIRKRPPIRPRFELLEDRTLPAISITMAGAVSGTVNSSTALSAQFSDNGYGSGEMYNATISWGDGSNSTGTLTTQSPQGSNIQGSVQASHTYMMTGTFTVGLTVSGMRMGGGGTGTASATATVTSQPPVVTSPGAQASAEGALVSLQVSATDPNGYPLTYAATGLPSGLTCGSGGLISGTVSSSAAETSGGSYTVAVTATDSHGASGTATFAWTVTDTNRPPSVTNPGSQQSAEGNSISLQISASDPDGDPLTYSASGLPAGLAIASSSGLIGGTVSYAAAESSGGSYSVTVTATDSHGAGSSQTFAWTVTNTDRPPAVVNPGNQSNAEGSQVSLQVSASDPDASEGDTLTYAAAGLPAGLTISAQTGAVSGTVSYGDAATGGGSYSTTVTATDSHGASSSQTFVWTVTHTNQAPSVTNPGAQSNAEGNQVTLQLSATDPDGDSLTYSASGLPAGLSVASTSGLISGAVSYSAAETNGGSYSVTVTAADGQGASSSQTFSWTVTNTDRPPAVVNPGNQSSAEGSQVNLQVSASDPDASEGDTLTYAAAGLPSGLSISAQTGLISGTLSYSAAETDRGSYTVTVTATDSHGVGTGQSFTWTITNTNRPPVVTNPGSQSSPEGGQVGLQVTASDPDASEGDTLTYAAAGLPAGLAIDAHTGLISGTVSYGDAATGGGRYNTTVTATDSHGASSSQTFAWTVTHTNQAPSVTNPGSQSNREGDAVSLQVQASDPDGDTLTYSATGLPDGLSVSTSTGLISGTIRPGAAEGGPFTTTVSANDGTDTAAQTFTWNVSSPISVTSPGSQSNAEGDAVSLQVQANDATGGTLSYSAKYLPAGLAIDPTTGLVSGTIAAGAAQDSPLTTTLTAGDGTYSDSQTFTWNVSTPVTITAPGDQSSAEGAAVSLQLQATDSSGGTLAYAATGLPDGLGIDASSGLISGVVGPSTIGPELVVVTAGDGRADAQVTFTWNVSSPVAVTNPGAQSSREGQTIALQIRATDASGGTVAYSATGLPDGLSMDPRTGLISGIVGAGAPADGPFVATITADDGRYADSQTFTWEVGSRVAVTNPGDQSNSQGDVVSVQVQASDAAGGTLIFSAKGLPGGLGIDPSTGLLSGTVEAGGSYQVTVTATDGAFSDTQAFAWDVSSPVTLLAPGNQASQEGGAVALSMSASDASGGALSYAATGLPPGLGIDRGSGLISGTIPAGASAGGPYTTTVTASDGTWAYQQTFTWDVSSPVTITSPGDQASTEGDAVALQVRAGDASAGTLTYAATQLPPGLAIDPKTGLISGSVRPGAAAGGPFASTVTATDGTYTASLTFRWDVSSPVAIPGVGGQVNVEGDAVALPVQATDAKGGTLTYAATGLPAGLSIDPGSGLISGIVGIGAAADSPFTTTVTVTDGTYSASQTFQWTVSLPVTTTTPADQANLEGDTVALQIQASDPAGGGLSYTAAGLPDGLTIDARTGLVSGTISAGAAADGPFEATITASDGPSSAQATFAWNVTSPVTVTSPGDQSNVEGDTVTLQVRASDATGGTVTYAAEGLPDGLSIDPNTGLISGTVSTGAADDSPFTTTLTAADGTYSARQTFNWDISTPLTVLDPGDQGNAVGDMVALQIQASDPTGGTLSYAATGLPAGLAIDPSSGLISGTIGAGAAAAYQTTVTATDGTASASAAFNWSVAAVADPVKVTNPGNQTSTDGDSVSLQIKASDTSGGTLTYSATGLPDGLSIDPNTGLISGTVSAGASGDNVFSTTITAGDGSATGRQTFAWVVQASSTSTSSGPVTVLNPGNQSGSEGSTVALQVEASDSSGGTLAYSATGLPPGLSIDAGSGLISGTISSGGAANGPFAVTVKASDGNGSASQTFQWSVSSTPTSAGNSSTPASPAGGAGSAFTSPGAGLPSDLAGPGAGATGAGTSAGTAGSSSSAPAAPSGPAAVMPSDYAGNAGDPGATAAGGTRSQTSTTQGPATGTSTARGSSTGSTSGGATASQSGSSAPAAQVASGSYHRHYTLSGNSSTAAFYLDVTIDSTFGAGITAGPGSTAPGEKGTVTYTAWLTEMGTTVYDDEDVVVPFNGPVFAGTAFAYFGLPAGGAAVAGYDPATLGIADAGPWDHESWNDAVAFSATGSYVDTNGATYQFANHYTSTSWWKNDVSWTPGSASGAGTQVATYQYGGSYTADVTASDNPANFASGTPQYDASGYPAGMLAAPAQGSSYLAHSFDTQTYSGNSTVTAVFAAAGEVTSTAQVAHSQYNGSNAYRNYYSGTVTTGGGAAGQDTVTQFVDYQATGTYGGSQDTNLTGTGFIANTGTVTMKWNSSATILADTYNYTDAFSLDSAGIHMQDTYQFRSGLDGSATASDRETLQQVYGSNGQLTTNTLTYRTEADGGSRVSGTDQGSFTATATGAGGAAVGRSSGSWYASSTAAAHAHALSSGVSNLLNQSGSVDNSSNMNGSSTWLSSSTVTASAADGSYLLTLSAFDAGGSNSSGNYRAGGSYNAGGQQTSGTSFVHTEGSTWDGGGSRAVRRQPGAPLQTTIILGNSTSSSNATVSLSYGPAGTASGSIDSGSNAAGDQDVTTTAQGFYGPPGPNAPLAYADDRDHRHEHATATSQVHLTLTGGSASGSVQTGAGDKVTDDYTVYHTVDLADGQLHASLDASGDSTVQATDNVTSAVAGKSVTSTRTFTFARQGHSNSDLEADGSLSDGAGHTGSWNLSAVSRSQVNDKVTINYAAAGAGPWKETGRQFHVNESGRSDSRFHEQDNGVGAPAVTGSLQEVRRNSADASAESGYIRVLDGTPTNYTFSLWADAKQSSSQTASRTWADSANHQGGDSFRSSHADSSFSDAHEGTSAGGDNIRYSRIDTHQHQEDGARYDTSTYSPTGSYQAHQRSAHERDRWQDGNSSSGAGQQTERWWNAFWWHSQQQVPSIWGGMTTQDLSGGDPRGVEVDAPVVDLSWGARPGPAPNLLTVFQGDMAQGAQAFANTPAVQWLAQNRANLANIVTGLFGIALGSAMVAGGVETGGLSLVLGLGLIEVSADQIVNGMVNIGTGQSSMSVFQFAGYSAAKGLGFDEQTSQVIGALTPAALSLGFGLGGSLLEAVSAAPAGSAAVEAEAGDVASELGACFAAGTPLLTPTGCKAIEEFRAGDLVLARPEWDAGAAVEAKAVQEIFIATAPILHLHVGGQVIRTTPEHPFYVRGRGWVAASQIRPGEELSGHDGRWVSVEDMLETGEYERVYNVRVADYRTYFVGGYEWGFSAWAHNACVQVTSWAERGITPDLNSGRWVQLGGPTLWNYIKTGLWGGRFGWTQSIPWIWRTGNAPIWNSITDFVDESRLMAPPGWESWKAILGQRVLR